MAAKTLKSAEAVSMAQAVSNSPAVPQGAAGDPAAPIGAVEGKKLSGNKKKTSKSILDKFNDLPMAGKVAVAAGAGLALYYLIRAFGRNQAVYTAGNADGTQSDQAVFLYPGSGVEDSSAYDNTGSDLDFFTGGSSGSGSSSGGGISSGITDLNYSQKVDDFYGWNGSYMENVSGKHDVMQQGTLPAGAQVVPQAQTVIVSGAEGKNTYRMEVTGDGVKTIYKNGVVVPEENYKYIPQEFGGTRTTGAGLGTGISSGSTNKSTAAGSSSGASSSANDPNKALQQAQAAYGAAKTDAERKAAAAAGQAARAAGATDAGAQKVWKDQAAAAKG